MIAQGLRDERVVVLLAVVSEQFDESNDATYALQFASKRLRNDFAVVLAAVTKYGMCLEYASLEMRAHREIVLVSVESSGNSLQFASDELRDTKVRIWLTLSPLSSFSLYLFWLLFLIFIQKDVVLVACTKDGMALRFASLQLCQDQEVLLVAVARNGKVNEVSTLLTHSFLLLHYHSGLALQHAALNSISITIVLAAVANSGYALQFCLRELIDHTIMRTACVTDGLALQFCPHQDKEIAILACSQNGMALRFVAPELCKVRSVILAACARFGRALEFVDPPLNNDRIIVLVAVSNDGAFRDPFTLSLTIFQMS